MNLMSSSLQCRGPKTAMRLVQYFSFFLLLMAPLAGKAVVKWYPNTPAFQRNFKGYTIVQIPGSSNYLAFGTVYDPQVVFALGGPYAGYDGLHCLKLNSSGAVLNNYWFGTFAANPANVTNWWSYKVVDFTTFTNNRYWVTLQIRHKNAGAQRDFFMCLEVDSTGTGYGSRWFKFVGTANPGNVYATHSLCYNNKMYICGYTTETSTQYPAEPTTYSLRKKGFIAVYNINPLQPVSFNNQLVWESGQGLYTDYDMALRMKLNSSNQLFVTGSLNVGDNSPSGIMAMVVDPNTLNIIYKKGYLPAGQYISPGYSYTAGHYGIDMWQDQVNGGYYILSNRFDGHGNIGWSVSHVEPDLKLSAGVHYMELKNLPDEWADRVYEGPNGTHTIIGQQIILHNPGNPIPNPNKQPGYDNVNPFFSNAEWVYDPLNGGLSNHYNWHKIQPSTVGTQVTGSIDYLKGNSSINNSLLEDVGRLYKHFAVQVNNDPNDGFAMINPLVADDAIHLTQKFVTVDVNADELSCQQTHVDANPDFIIDKLLDMGWINTATFPSSSTWNGYQAMNRVASVTVKDCNSGYYKTSGPQVEETEAMSETNAPVAGKNLLAYRHGSIKVYPNPAKDFITIETGGQPGESGVISLTDVLGKEIFRKEVNMEPLLTVPLSNIAPGVYNLMLSAGSNRYVNKVVVEYK